VAVDREKIPSSSKPTGTEGWGLRETNTIRVLEKGQSCRDVGSPGEMDGGTPHLEDHLTTLCGG